MQSSANADILGCTFTGNYSDCIGIADGNNNGNYGGGALRLNSTGTISVDSCVFNNNNLTPSSNESYNHAYGGAVYINAGGTFKFNACKFKDNSAVRGGAFCAWATGAKVYMNGCSFDGNYISFRYGTTIHIEKAADFCMNNCSINDNTWTAKGTADWNAAWVNLSTINNICLSNCSFIGSPKIGETPQISEVNNAIVRFDNIQDGAHYFVNNIIVTEGAEICNKSLCNYNKEISAYFTKRSDNSVNGAGGSYTMIETPGSNGFDKTMFSDLAWNATDMCWKWSGNMTGGNNKALADAATAVNHINEIPAFKSWLESINALYKDQLGNSRPSVGSWWPGAYQGNLP